MRTFRRVLLALLIVAVAAAAALMGTARPALDDARNEAEARWVVVARPLDERYTALAAVAATVEAAGGSVAELASETVRATQHWTAVVVDDDVSAQVRSANELEGLSRRLAATIDASARLRDDAAVTQAREDLATHAIPDTALAYNTAVAAYEQEREGTLRSIAASALGYDSLPALDVASSGES